MDVTRRQFTWLTVLGVAGGMPGALHAAAPAGARPSAGAVWAELMAGNKRFVAGKPRPRALVDARRELAKGQHPRATVLACSDSRVSPTLVFDQSLGELFVIRTAGNVADPVGLGSIEYAVEHLHTPLLVVVGHDKCGAVSAAASGARMPTPGLEAIVRKIAPAVESVRGRAEGDELIRLAVEANVHRSARDLVEGSPVLRKEVDAGQLAIVKAVYRLATGEVVRLA